MMAGADRERGWWSAALRCGTWPAVRCRGYRHGHVERRVASSSSAAPCPATRSSQRGGPKCPRDFSHNQSRHATRVSLSPIHLSARYGAPGPAWRPSPRAGTALAKDRGGAVRRVESPTGRRRNREVVPERRGGRHEQVPDVDLLLDRCTIGQRSRMGRPCSGPDSSTYRRGGIVGQVSGLTRRLAGHHPRGISVDDLQMGWRMRDGDAFTSTVVACTDDLAGARQEFLGEGVNEAIRYSWLRSLHRCRRRAGISEVTMMPGASGQRRGGTTPTGSEPTQLEQLHDPPA